MWQNGNFEGKINKLEILKYDIINQRVNDICGVKQGCDRSESWDEGKTVKHDCHSSAPSASFVRAFYYFISMSFLFFFGCCCSTSFVWIFFHCRDIIPHQPFRETLYPSEIIHAYVPTLKLSNNMHCHVNALYYARRTETKNTQILWNSAERIESQLK